ncbi:unnamed protein product [Paramecium octaurelia]|uniref:Macro domain-containing protein n=1 Tax=Paramecium octaurelia TaxID=43137 RepID=A0A8S1TRF8_PAROT|nr:unnamed protein product [Paramecium octaurelia]
MGQYCCVYEQNTQVQQENHSTQLIMEKIIHNITIKLTQGKLIDENVDAVVAMADPQFNVTSHLSRQILKMGGKQMYENLLSCQRKKQTIDFGDVIYTHAEELDFDFIFFALLPPFYEIDYDQQIRRQMRSFQYNGDDSIESSIQEYTGQNEKQYIQHSIKKTLLLCNDLGLSSVSFPVISSEAQINSKCYTALVMLLTIKQFIEEKHSQLKNLQLINITIADKAYIKPFRHVLNRLTDGQQIVDYYETPQLGPQEDNQVDSFENEIIQFGKMYKNRKDDRSKQQDSI